MQNGIGFTRMTSDGQVTNGPCLLFGISVEPATTGKGGFVYEGNDASSGRLLGAFRGYSTVSNFYMFPHPVYCDRGLFITLEVANSSMTVYWLPVRNEGV